MDWHRLAWIIGPAIAVAIVTWFGSPIVKNWLEGTPLNGLRRLVGKPLAPTQKTALSIIVLTAPEPKWHVGAVGKEPMLALSIHANMAHRSDVSIKIVQAYLKGTKPCGVFIPFIVAGPYDPPSVIHFSVRPIVVKGRDKLTRRVILVDQFGDKHITAPVTFMTVPVDPWRRGVTSESPTIKCHVCDLPIAMMELHESAAMPAHKKCVK